MCLIVLAFDHHPDYALVLAANRDEFYDRPTAPAHFWDEQPGLLAGRDERAGGTWMGITRAGRFAAITNYRDPGRRTEGAPSRGGIVTDFLTDDRSPLEALDDLSLRADRYNGFSLLAGAFTSASGREPALAYFSNRSEKEPRPVAPGIHGLSNHLLDTSWPKVDRATEALRAVLAEEGPVRDEPLLDLLSRTAPAPDAVLPDTGVPKEWERALSSVFIQSEHYGTRSSTVLLVGRSGAVTFVERSFEEGDTPTDRRFSFRIEAPAPV